MEHFIGPGEARAGWPEGRYCVWCGRYVTREFGGPELHDKVPHDGDDDFDQED